MEFCLNKPSQLLACNCLNIMNKLNDEYENDSSDEEEVQNTIGNVPFEWYEKESHIGYDITGRQIVKPSSANKGVIDSFLDNCDNTDRSRIVKDPNTGQDVILSDGDIALIRTLCNSRGFLSSLDDDFVSDWFTREKMETPISAVPPQKTSFIPSLSDKKKVSLIVSAIKSGRMKMPQPIDKDQYLDADYYDIYNQDVPNTFTADYGKWKLKHVPDMYLEWLPPHLRPNYETNYQRSRDMILPPNVALPGSDKSYRAPEEYLLTDQEKKVCIKRFFDKSYNPCKHLDEKPLFPTRYDNLRSVGYHHQSIIDMEKRVKDKTFAARVKKETVNSSTEKMLGQTRPEPKKMEPYPNLVIGNGRNTDDAVLSIGVSYCGGYVATVGYTALKIWLTAQGILKRCYPLHGAEDRSLRNPSVAWSPYSDLIAVAIDNMVRIINPRLSECDEVDPLMRQWWTQSVDNRNGDKDESEGEEPMAKKAKTDEDEPTGRKAKETKKNASQSATWNFVPAEKNHTRLTLQGNSLSISVTEAVLELSWHSGGDYLHTICGKGRATNSGGILQLHRVSRCASQTPFSGHKLQWMSARFHPIKSVPLLYLAECAGSTIKVYHLVEKRLVKTLQLTSGHPSVMQVHPSGNHLVVGTFEGHMCWFDLEMGVTPFKTMNLTGGSIRSLALHTQHSLLSCATANGTVVVIYAKVSTSYDENPSIHTVALFQRLDKSGDMYTHVFHPVEPTLYCGGADKSMRVIQSSH